MSETRSRAAHVTDILDTFQRTMHGTPSVAHLQYATGLLLGVRCLLETLDELQRWGECAAALLAVRYAVDAAMGEEEP